MSNRGSLFLFLVLVGALASCGGPVGSRGDVVVDSLGRDDNRGSDSALDGLTDGTSSSDVLPGDLAETLADVPSPDGMSDLDALALDLSDLPDLSDGDSTEVSELPDSVLDSVDQADETGGSQDVDEPYFCPAGGGKIGGMPECPYLEPTGPVEYFQVLQFVRWEPGIEPGLPEGFTPLEGQVLALVRARWHDPFANPDGFGIDMLWVCPECEGFKGCGGHCFFPQNYVWVVDMVSMTLVHVAKEPESTLVLSELPPCPNTYKFYCLSFLELGRQLVFQSALWLGWGTGSDNEVPNALWVSELEEWNLIQSISIPLY